MAETNPPNRADDPGGLLAEARLEHRANPDWLVDVPCTSCRNPWPCLTARLADALEVANDQLTASRFGAETDADLNQHLSEMLRAARAEAAALRAGLNDLEWSSRERTVAGNSLDFCPVCHGSPAHVKLNPHLAPRNGHRRTCKLADLLGYPPALAQFIPATPPEEPARTEACSNCSHSRHDGFCQADQCHCISGYITREPARE